MYLLYSLSISNIKGVRNSLELRTDIILYAILIYLSLSAVQWNRSNIYLNKNEFLKIKFLILFRDDKATNEIPP